MLNLSVNFSRYLFVLIHVAEVVLCNGQLFTVSSPAGQFIGSVGSVNAFGQNKQYVQFLGIPYAEPPTGNRRFSKPVAKAPLNDPYNATFLRPACHQGGVSQLGGVEPKSEDCLFLNIYAPGSIQTNSSEKIPVIIYIHGGGFIRGSANDVHPADILTTHGDVIVVCMNYRLTVFGFLSAGDDIISGNFGLWDQQLAIQWVHDNIDSFHGDSNLVTIHGVSVGGASVIFHALYPSNAGLFRRIIADSAAALATFKEYSILTKPQATSFARLMNCDRSTVDEMKTCLQDKTIEELLNAVRTNSSILFLPVIDGEFLKGPPLEMLTSTDSSTQAVRDIFSSVDFLTGVCGMEGAVLLQVFFAPMLNTTLNNMLVSRTFFVDVVIPFVTDRTLKDQATNDIKETVLFQYSDLRDPENPDKNMEMLVKLSSAFEYFVPSVLAADLHQQLSNNTKTFFHQFTPALSFLRPFRPPWLTQANHGDTTIFSFGFSPGIVSTYGLAPLQSQAENDLSQAMITMWTNFAKSGSFEGKSTQTVNHIGSIKTFAPRKFTPDIWTKDPNRPVATPGIPRWPPYNSQTRPYLELSLNMSNAAKTYFAEPDVTFWLDILPRFLRESEPPSATTVAPSICKVERFGLTTLEAENIITILIVLCACFLLFIVLVFCFLCCRKKPQKYNLRKT